jgi:hypothetical protein
MDMTVGYLLFGFSTMTIDRGELTEFRLPCWYLTANDYMYIDGMMTLSLRRALPCCGGCFVMGC